MNWELPKAAGRLLTEYPLICPTLRQPSKVHHRQNDNPCKPSSQPRPRASHSEGHRMRQAFLVLCGGVIDDIHVVSYAIMRKERLDSTNDH